MVCPHCTNSKDHGFCPAITRGNPQLCDCQHRGSFQDPQVPPASQPVTHHSELQLPETGANRASPGDTQKNLGGPRHLRFGK